MDRRAEIAAKQLAARLELSRRAVSRRAVTVPPASRAAPFPIEWEAKPEPPRKGKRKPKGPLGGPKPPSSGQWWKINDALSYLSDDGTHTQYPSRSQVLAFVSFANAYFPGPFSSLHFVLAINLALRGRNVYGTAEQLVAFAEGDPLPEPNLQAHFAGLKNGKRR